MRLLCRRHLPPKRQFIYFRLVPYGMTRHHQKNRRLLRKIDRSAGVFCARVGVFCARVLPYCGWFVCCGLGAYGMTIHLPKRHRVFGITGGIMRLSCRRHLPPKRQLIYFRLVPCGMTRHHQKSRRLFHKIDLRQKG